METVSEWQPITDGSGLELSILDKGEYHRLAFPCRRDGLTWRDGSTNRIIPIEPTHSAAGIARTFDKRCLKLLASIPKYCQFCSMSAASY